MTHTERRQQWKARIEAYKASGLSAREILQATQHNHKTAVLLAKKRNFKRTD